MKPILVIALGIGALAGGAIGAALLAIFVTTPGSVAPTATPTGTTEYVVTKTDDGNTLELASLRVEIDQLRDELSLIRSERETAVEPETTPVAAVSTSVPSRDMIIGVMQQEEDRKEEERQLEREEREQEALKRRVDRIAEKLSLSTADQTTLVQIYTQEREKQSAMWTEMRDGGMDRDMIREGMSEVRDWRTEQLNLSFGEDLASQISEESGGRGGWGDWGGGRGGNTGGGGGGRGGGRGN